MNKNYIISALAKYKDHKKMHGDLIFSRIDDHESHLKEQKPKSISYNNLYGYQ